MKTYAYARHSAEIGNGQTFFPSCAHFLKNRIPVQPDEGNYLILIEIKSNDGNGELLS
jgi:hypothetical protein